MMLRRVSRQFESFLARHRCSSLQPANSFRLFRSCGLQSDEYYADINWDKIGFKHVPTDYMYTAKCSRTGEFSQGVIGPLGGIQVSPSAGVLNYGQGMFEGLKAHRKVNERDILLFRPDENALRMKKGAERMCMPSPSPEQFVNAVKQVVLANRRWIPPPGKGALYIRPLLLGTGPILGLAPAPEYTFLAYACPVGNYFKEGLAELNLYVEDNVHRATPGGAGDVKTISNYAPVLKAQMNAKNRGFSDVLFIDSVQKRFIDEAASSNIFIANGNVISTPSLERGTILPGITRKTIIQLGRILGYKVEERDISIEELSKAEQVFCTGTAVVVAPVGSVTYKDHRFEYRNSTVSSELHKILTGIQNGALQDNMDWTVSI